MPIRPTRRCDDRRRRLLQEKILGGELAREAAGDLSPPPRTSAGAGSRYAKAAAMSQQPRVTDLVPKRKLTLLALFLLGLSVIAGLEWLYAWMPAVASVTSDERVAAFDLDGEGSLAAWFSSTVLALAGLAAVLVYSLRRHRLDDYGGRYRIWLWAAACWFVMSIDEAASLHEGFKEMMTYLTGERLHGDGSLWWVMAYAAVLGLIGLALLWDMWQSRFSSLCFVLSGGCYAAAVTTQMEFLLPAQGARAVMLEEGLEMLGNLWLLLAMAAHARCIIRDIEGLNKRRAARKPRQAAKPQKKAAPAANAAPPAKSLRQDPAETTAPAAHRKLTKAQRRAARKQS